MQGENKKKEGVLCGAFFLYGRKWCRLRESDPRPSLYRSDALPAELNRRFRGRLLASRLL